ncbi:MAG: adenosine kinase [Planctomycetales bacterium]|nr:adenosine kinase [Planctomycetales bacterium]
MTDKQVDVFGVGNALVDILAMVNDDFLTKHQLDKGGMSLCDSDAQAALLNDLEGELLEMKSGGSAANTMIAITQSGGSGIYTGRVASDKNGEFYRLDMVEAGIRFDVDAAAAGSAPTGTSLILTTPDAERTMCTNLGVSIDLDNDDIDYDALAKCKYCYIEGYLWDPEIPRATSIKVMEKAKELGVKVSFTFSDPFLVSRYAVDFRRVAKELCDVVFCNADEARHFCQTDSLDAAVVEIGQLCDLVFVTDGPHGCRVVRSGNATHIPGFSVKALDTVGAGDAFAGGVLFGLTNGYSPEQSAKWGNYLAAQVVTIHGARLPGEMTSELAKVLA